MTAPLSLPSQYEKFDDPNNSSWRDYFLKLNRHVNGVARLEAVTQTFSGEMVIENASIESGGILLAPGGYSGLLTVNKVSSNADSAGLGGGNAAIYVQHQIDGSVANQPTANIGIRVQVESAQQASIVTTNDAVSGYFGLRTTGVDIGAFGIHVDAYHAQTGTRASTYGASAEMFRTTPDGFTAGFHTRTTGPFLGITYLDNDYGFLASPGGDGTAKFKTAFSAGSANTGTLRCDIGVDLARATCEVGISLRTPADKVLVLDGLSNQITFGYNSIGRLDYGVSGVLMWGVENGGRQFYVNNANTVVGGAFTPSGSHLVVNVGGTLRKIQLGVFP
jgi:hypothetical protein